MTSPIARGRSLLRSIETWIEGHRMWPVAALSVLFLGVVFRIAALKPLENDEIYTLYMVRLPTMSDLWAALLSGGEQLPPLFYVLTKAGVRLLGESPLSLRLPAILGFWVMTLCLYRFVSRRSTALLGLSAMLFPLATGAYYYAFEGRPYGLVLGCCGVALVAWQSRADGDLRPWPLLGMAVGLAGAISCHYYAVLALVPLGCGELVRTLTRKRLDVSVWFALSLSLLPLWFFLPLIASARSYGSAFWATPRLGDVPDFFYFIMASAAIPLTAALLLGTLDLSLGGDEAEDLPPGHSHAPPRIGLRLHEVAAAVTFLSLPAVAVAMAMLVTGAYTHRYVIVAFFGLGILVPFSWHLLARSRGRIVLLVVVVLAVGFVRRAGMTNADSTIRAESRQAVVRLLQADSSRDSPIVCSDSHLFVILSEYAPPEIRARLVYLADPAASLRHLHHDSIERGMIDLLSPWFGLHVQRYETFVQTKRPFLLLGNPQEFLNWILPDLTARGAALELRDEAADTMLFFVQPER